MEHPLDDCRLKIARAKRDFDALQTEMAKFGENNRYGARVHVDPETQEHALNFGKPPSLPRDWGAEAGEIGVKCRGALDYLINVFIRKAGGEPKGQFPIGTSETEYFKPGRQGVTYRDRLLDGFPEPLRDRIDGFQPYKAGDQAHVHPLALLANLSNADKHRLPQTTYVAIDLPAHVVCLPTSDPVENLTITLPSPADISVEAKMARSHAPDAMAVQIHPKVQVDWHIGVEFVFGREFGKPLISMVDLRNVIAATEEIVESFAADAVAP